MSTYMWSANVEGVIYQKMLLTARQCDEISGDMECASFLLCLTKEVNGYALFECEKVGSGRMKLVSFHFDRAEAIEAAVYRAQIHAEDFGRSLESKAEGRTG